MKPIEYAIVGGGWRAEFYLRIARALPERFVVQGMVVRDAAKGQAIEGAWGVPTYRTLDALLQAHRPPFVLTCVSWEANPPLIRELAARGIPVLSETPPAPDVARMAELCALVKQGARIQVAEQYIYQPHHAARLAFARSGALGTISQAQVSAAHGYHGTSLIRHFLGIGYENVRVTARNFRSPLIGGPDRQGAPRGERMTSSSQTIAWLDFGDRLGVFDFTGEQYFSWVRGQRLLVRGERGEINNHEAEYLSDYATPVEVAFRRVSAGANGNLEGLYLKGIVAGDQWVYRNPFAPGRLTDDEIAIATCVAGMAAYVEGGPEVYPLAEACQDRYLDMLIAQAAESGKVVESSTQSWAEG
jgi:predicted dehydrogenase